MGEGGGRPPAPRRIRPRPLRGGRPLLPLAVRAPLQLRADVGPPRGLDLLGPVRRGDPLRRDGLRAREARPRRRGHRLLRGGSQGDGPLLDVGAARRARPRRQPGPPAEGAPTSACASRTCSASAATRRARRRSSASSARRPSTGTRPRRRLSSSSRPAPRASGSRARSASPWRPATTTGRRPPGPRGGGRGRPHPRARGGGAGRGRHRLSRQRRLPRGLEPGLDRLEPRVPRGRRRPATTCSGRRWSCSTCTTGT